MKLRDIKKFEEINKKKEITVNVYGIKEWYDRQPVEDDEMEESDEPIDRKHGYVYPIRISASPKNGTSNSVSLKMKGLGIIRQLKTSVD